MHACTQTHTIDNTILVSISSNTNTDSNTETNTHTHTQTHMLTYTYICTYIHIHRSQSITHIHTRRLGNIKATVVEDDAIVNDVLPVEQFWIKPMQEAPYKEVT